MTDHLSAIDPEQWPRITNVPTGIFAGMRARKAEAEFATACSKAGLHFADEDGVTPDLRVAHDAVFSRIAHSGWLGLAEGYMAGEWSTDDSDQLVHVLTRLLGVGYHPKAKPVPVEDWDGEELSSELIKLFAGDGMTTASGVYSSGVPTTVREEVTNYVPSKPGKAQPKAHFVDITRLTEPHGVDRDDLSDSQERAADWLLDAARIGAGSHVLINSATGAQLAIRASNRRATTDIITADSAHAQELLDQLILAGARESVHVQVTESLMPTPKEWRGRYDAVLSMEKFEYLSPRQRKAYLAALDRHLAPGGRLAIQAVTATENMTGAGQASIDVLRAYIWPGLEFPTVAELHKLCDKGTGLRIVAETHLGEHYRESLRQQRSYFEGHIREAAAMGYDAVFRRLWLFQFALLEALASMHMTEAVQCTATHRNRGGRR